MPVEEQVVSIFAGVNGFLDTVPTDAVTRFESALLEPHAQPIMPTCSATIRDTKALDDDTAGQAEDDHRRFREDVCVTPRRPGEGRGLGESSH